MNREVTGSEHEISEAHGPEADDDVALTEDLLLGGRVRLKQPKAGFRAAIDPVILAAAIPARPGDLVELGCGTGAASLCFLKRLSEKQLAATSVLGFELQPHLAELARQQRKDGAWINKNARWLEGDENLVTGYALLALSVDCIRMCA